MTSVARCSHAAAMASAVSEALVAVPRRSSNLSPRVQILGFLLPRYAAAPLHTVARSTCPEVQAQQTRRCGLLHPSNAHEASVIANRPMRQMRARPFSTTPTRARTQAVLNPQTDEDGNEMKLEITPRAAKRLAKLMEKEHNDKLALRVQVESGGCHGFQYLMSLVTLPPQLPTAGAGLGAGVGTDSETEIREDDTIFVYAAEEEGGSADAAANPLATPKIILDTPSLELLKGSKVDFTTELIGSQFKIVDNPLATSSCGCGTSFDIKV